MNKLFYICIVQQQHSLHSTMYSRYSSSCSSIPTGGERSISISGARIYKQKNIEVYVTYPLLREFFVLALRLFYYKQIQCTVQSVHTDQFYASFTACIEVMWWISKFMLILEPALYIMLLIRFFVCSSLSYMLYNVFAIFFIWKSTWLGGNKGVQRVYYKMKYYLASKLI